MAIHNTGNTMQYLSCGTHASTRPNGSFSVMGWIRPTAVWNSWYPIDILSTRIDWPSHYSPYYGYQFGLIMSGDSKLYVFLYVLQGNNDVTTTSYANYATRKTATTTTWYHVAFTYEVGVAATPYWNGVAEVQTGGGTDLTPCVYGSGTALRIGSNENNAQAMIEDVRLYDRALSADEIYHIYVSRGQDSIETGGISRWPLITKSSGNAEQQECFDIWSQNHANPMGEIQRAPSNIVLPWRSY